MAHLVLIIGSSNKKISGSVHKKKYDLMHVKQWLECLNYIVPEKKKKKGAEIHSSDSEQASSTKIKILNFNFLKFEKEPTRG